MAVKTDPQATHRSRDQVISVIAEHQRRQVLESLAKADAPMDLDALVEGIGPGCDGPNVHISLYHRHIPKLEEAGLITFERDRAALTRAGERVIDTLFAK